MCPVQVIAITDGEPAGEPVTTVLNVIKSAKNMCANSPYGPGAIAFQFAQVRTEWRHLSGCDLLGQKHWCSRQEMARTWCTSNQ